MIYDIIIYVRMESIQFVYESSISYKVNNDDNKEFAISFVVG